MAHALRSAALAGAILACIAFPIHAEKLLKINESLGPGSPEEFIFEHYYVYNKLNEKTIVEYSLAHPRWQIYKVTNYKLDCAIEKLYNSKLTNTNTIFFINDA